MWYGQHTMRQQYERMNQSIFHNSLLSSFDAGISPQTKRLDFCRNFVTNILAGGDCFEFRMCWKTTPVVASPNSNIRASQKKEEDVFQVEIRDCGKVAWEWWNPRRSDFERQLLSITYPKADSWSWSGLARVLRNCCPSFLYSLRSYNYMLQLDDH